MDAHLVQIIDLVKDYAKNIDELSEENKAVREKSKNQDNHIITLDKIINNLRKENLELIKKTNDQSATINTLHKDSSFWKQREELKEENRILRQALSDIAANLGNGSTVSVEASVPFIKELPHEVKLVCDRLRKELAREKKTCNNLRKELQNPPPDVQEKVLDMLGVNKRLIQWFDQYNELRREVERLMSSENTDLKFVLNHNLKHILKKHDEQGDQDEQDTQVHKNCLTEIYGVSYQTETDIVRNFYPKTDINEAYRSWQEVVKKYPNATIQRQVIKNGKVVSVENQIPRGFY